MANDFLASLEQEGAINPGLKEEEKETPPASPTEKQPEDTKASPAEEKEEGETPKSEKGEKPEVFQAFHKHPRWIASQAELKELREFRERVEPLLEQLGEESEKPEEKTEIPGWFVDLFGENKDAWAKYRSATMAERKQLREEILNEVRAESQKAADEAKKWNQHVDKELGSIIGDEEVAARAKAIGFDFSNKDQLKSFRNELLDVATKFQPIDDESQLISLQKSFDILELQKLRKQEKASPAESKRKEIAGRTMEKGAGEGQKKSFMTSHDLAGKSFRDLIPEEA